MAEPPRLPPHDDIGDEALAPVKWLIPRWPEIKFWLWTGFFAGVALVTGLLGAAVAAGWQLTQVVGVVLGLTAVITLCIGAACIYFGREARGLRLDEHKAKQAAWERQVRQDAIDDREAELSEKYDQQLKAASDDFARREREAQKQVLAARALLIEEGRKMAESALQVATEAAERTAIAEWTPDVVGVHVGCGITGIALFAADRHSGKPVLYIGFALQSIAKVACEVVIATGTCRLYSLPTPGRMICELPFDGTSAPFDGSLQPGTIVAKRDRRISLSDTIVTELGALAIPVVEALIEVQVAYRLDGKLYPLPQGSAIQRAVALPPEWSKASSKRTTLSAQQAMVRNAIAKMSKESKAALRRIIMTGGVNPQGLQSYLHDQGMIITNMGPICTELDNSQVVRRDYEGRYTANPELLDILREWAEGWQGDG